MNKRYFSLVMNEEKSEADINIFGDITSFANYKDDSWLGQLKSETDYSAYVLSKQLEELGDVKQINVHINSYGGEVAEGLAIYNALKNHKAKIKTYCDGFACSIASVIFMAGDERIMSKSSLLMIHNAWLNYVQGNANDLRKQADDLDKITQASINAYMEHANVTEEEIKELLDNESWLDYKECLEIGFATSVVNDSKDEKASQSVKNKVIQMILQAQDEEEDEEDVDNKDTNNNDEKDKTSEETSNDPEDEEDVDNDNNVDNEDDEDKENKDNDEEEDEATEKVVAFFKTMIGGIK